jgi:thiol-disulfide isomerase/thioredoxin
MWELAKKYKKYLLLLFVAVGVLAFLAYSFISPYGLFSGLSNDLKLIEPSEEFAYTDLDGNAVRLASFKGKPLIINSWATWIPFSQTELPLLKKIQSEQGDAVTILYINRMENAGTVRSFLGTFGVDDASKILLDPTDNFYKAIGGYAMPETVFYDSTGVLVSHVRGVLTEEELRLYIDAAKKGK